MQFNKVKIDVNSKFFVIFFILIVIFTFHVLLLPNLTKTELAKKNLRALLKK